MTQLEFDVTTTSRDILYTDYGDGTTLHPDDQAKKTLRSYDEARTSE